MKRSLSLLLFILTICQIVSAQQYIGVDVSGNLYRLNFQSSSGFTNQLRSVSPSAGLGFDFIWGGPEYAKRKVRMNKLVSLGIDYQVARLESNESGIANQWTLNYLGLRGGLVLVQTAKSRTTFMLESGLFLETLLNANQRTGFSEYNISSEINPVNYGLFIGPGLQYKISQEAATNLKIQYNHGLANLEQDQNQRAYLRRVVLEASIWFKL